MVLRVSGSFNIHQKDASERKLFAMKHAFEWSREMMIKGLLGYDVNRLFLGEFCEQLSKSF